MTQWKGIQLDYDFISSKDDTEAIPVCLTWKERQILLTILDPVGWETRWVGSGVTADTIMAWRDKLAYKLMGECAVDCAEVRACLGLSETGWTDLEAWLELQLQSNNTINQIFSGGGDGTVPSSISTVEMIDDCDKDELYGFFLQLVQFIDRAISDFFEKVEVLTNPVEFAAAVVPEISFVGAALGYVEQLQDSYIETYQANYDADLEIEYACDLLCLALDNDCTLTWEQLLSYFLERTLTELGDNDVIDLLLYYATGVWTGNEACHLSFATFCAICHFGGTYFGFDLVRIQQIWTSMKNDPDEDWETLCPCATRWRAKFDFTLGACGFTATAGSYSAGVGFVAALYTPSDPDSMRVLIDLDIGTDTATIRRVDIDVSSYTNGVWTGASTLWALCANIRYTDPHATRAELVSGGADTYSSDSRYTASTIGVDGRASRDDNPTGAMTIGYLEIWGSGEVPTAIETNATTFEEL